MKRFRLSILCIGMFMSLSCMANEQWRIYTGLSKYSGGQWTYYSTNHIWPYTLCVAADKNENKWIGTYQGISLLDSLGNWTSYTINNSSLSNNWIESAAIDSSNIKWFGTHGGVSSFNGTNWTNYKACPFKSECCKKRQHKTIKTFY